MGSVFDSGRIEQSNRNAERRTEREHEPGTEHSEV
jgi:hypothetical protein